jgi:cobalt-zinc-cadmium efflux system outer membrane protein
MGRRTFRAAILLLASAMTWGGLSSCASYQAKPIDLARSGKAAQNRSLDDPLLRDRLIELQLLTRDDTFPPARWNRAQLLVAAAALNADVLQARQQLQVAAAATITARALPAATVNLGSEYSLSQTSESPWLWSLSVDWLLDVGLRRQLRTQLADVNLRTARLTYAERLWSVRSQLRKALLSLLVNDQRVTLLETAVAAQSRLQSHQQQRVTLGEASSSELLSSNLELARLRTSLTESAAQRANAMAQMASLLTVPASTLLAQRFDWPELLQVTAVDESQLAHWRDQALLARSDLEQSVLAYQGAELELQQAVRQQYPQFSIGPGFTWDHGVHKATLGLSLGLPLFDHNRGPIAEAAARRELAGTQVLAVQAQVLNDVDAASVAYQNAISVLRTQIEQGDTAASLLQKQQQALRLGSADRLEVIAAELELVTRKLEVLDRVERMQQALAQLEDALRMPLSGPETSLGRSALFTVAAPAATQ